MSQHVGTKVVGFSILLPAVAIGILPLIDRYTKLTSSWSAFTLSLGGHDIVRYSTGHGYGSVWVNSAIWLVAAIGELIVMWLICTDPA